MLLCGSASTQLPKGYREMDDGDSIVRSLYNGMNVD